MRQLLLTHAVGWCGPAENSQVAIFDATNSTEQRRQLLVCIPCARDLATPCRYGTLICMQAMPCPQWQAWLGITDSAVRVLRELSMRCA